MGITKAHDDAELRTGLALAYEHDEKVLVEEFVAGIEVEVGVLGNLDADRISTRRDRRQDNEWYDYTAKYDDGEMDLDCPRANLREQLARAQALACARSPPPSARGWRGPTCSFAKTARYSSTS